MQESDGAAVDDRAPDRLRFRAELGLFLQLAGACGLVFARPILDAFGRAPEIFVEADTGWKAILLFGILWVVVPPAVLWLLAFATRVFGARVRRDAHVVVLAGLAAMFTAQALFQAQDWPIVLVWALGGVAAAVMALLWLRFGAWREFLAYLERLIALLGAEPVEYRGATKCCGFPMLTFNRDKSLAMAGNHIIEAKDKGADLLVTPCPLCHLNLDGQQPDAARVLKKPIDVPIFHLPQLLGLAFGLSPEELRLDHHVIPTKGALEKVELKV